MSKPKQGFSTVLANRNFRLLWADQILSQLSYNMVNFALILWVNKLTQSALATTLLALAMFAPPLLLGVFAGVAVDIFDRRKIMFFADVFWALGVLFLVFIKDQLFLVLLITFIVNCIDQFYFPSQSSSVPMVVKKRVLVTANSLFSTSIYLGMVAGAVLAGPLITHFGNDTPFIIASTLTLSAAVCVFFLPPLKPTFQKGSLFDEIVKALPGGNFVHALRETKKEIQEGFAFIFGRKTVYLPILLLTCTQFLIGTLIALGPGFFERVLKISAADLSYIIMAPVGAGLILGAMILGKWGMQFSRRFLISRAIILSGLLFFVFAFSEQIANFLGHRLQLIKKPLPFTELLGLSGVLMLIAFLFGLALVCVMVLSMSSIQEATPLRIRGRIFGVLNMITFGLVIVPIFLSGVLSEVFGFVPVLAGIGILVFILGLIAGKPTFFELKVLPNGKNDATITLAKSHD
ncbi:MAG: MFS transporter [bacterium]|nr:MFS transporter [bacterium]